MKLFALVLATALGATPLAAQATRVNSHNDGDVLKDRVPVLVLMDDGIGQSQSIIKGKVGPQGLDAVVVRSTATSGDLLRALRILQQSRWDSRRHSPDSVQRVQLRLKPGGATHHVPARGAEAERAERVLEKLRESQPAFVAGHGLARSIEIFLPKPTGKIVKAKLKGR